MPVENATYIGDLVPANPLHTDPLNQADAQIRLIKQVLQNTFPNVDAVVNAASSDLNSIIGLAATVTAFIASAPTLAGSNIFTALNTFNDGINATSIKKNGNELLPTGVICAWSGSVASIPAGWHLCDGTNGTPNLIGQFILGAASDTPTGLQTAPGQVGGALTYTGLTQLAGIHSHGGETALGGAVDFAGTTDSQGAHSHGGLDGAVQLTLAQMPAHSHTYSPGIGPSSATGGAFKGAADGYVSQTNTTATQGGSQPHQHTISTDGAHIHNVDVTAPAHQHVINSDPGHQHTIVVPTIPPFYSLAFIMKL